MHTKLTQKIFHLYQGDQIGRSSKLLTTKFLTKVAQIYGDNLGYFENMSNSNCWATFGNILAIFNPTSGHTHLCGQYNLLSEPSKAKP